MRHILSREGGELIPGMGAGRALDLAPGRRNGVVGNAVLGPAAGADDPHGAGLSFACCSVPESISQSSRNKGCRPGATRCAARRLWAIQGDGMPGPNRQP